MSESYHKENAWWVSPYNEEADVRGSMQFSPNLKLHDATLRDGEQTPGVVMSPDDKKRIADELMELGVERIEAGMPAVSSDDQKAIRMICRNKGDTQIFTFARAMKADVDMALECGADGVVVEVPIGYPKIRYQFGWTWETVLEKSVETINYAKQNGLYVVYFPYDTTRSRKQDLENLLQGIMNNAKPDSIGLVDTMGCALPQTIDYLVRKIKRMTGLPVEVHTHNDFGLAVATELAGAAAGAEVLHTCVNGLGERTGNAPLEELIMALKLLCGVEKPYKIERMNNLCRLVSELTGVPIAHNKPFSGAGNYARESGIGINFVMEQPLVMFATDPRYFGREAQVVLGKKSGKKSIEYMLDKMGVKANDEQISDMLLDVKELSIAQKRLVTVQEFETIAAKRLGEGSYAAKQ